MKIVLDENGYVKDYALIGFIPDGQEVNNLSIDLKDFEENYQSYKLIDGSLYKNEDKANENALEYKKNILRAQREKECFSYINRGIMWYERLTAQQKKELESWYDSWLNVTDTLEIPEKPSWI